MRRRSLLGAGLALAALPVHAAAIESADVLVAGGGLAGLYAARLLAAEGLTVIVLEAGAEVGGRLKTLDHLPGRPEAGGQTIGAMYARVRREMDALGLRTFPRAGPVPGDAILAGGQAMAAADWAASPANRLVGAARGMSPGRLYAHYLDRANPVAVLDDWRAPAHAGLDAIGVSALLRQGGADAEALRLMQHWFDGPSLPAMSAQFACRKRLAEIFEAGESWRVKGGSQALPRAMATSLGDAVRTGAVVAAISQDGRGVEMRTRDGRRYRGRFGICALPFPALARVALDPAPAPAFLHAVRSLPYSAILMVTLRVVRPFWEQDGLPPAMYVDGPVQRITAAGGQDGGLPTLACWLRGTSAARGAAMDDASLSAWVIDELAQARPASAGALAAGAVTRWDATSMSGGAYHYLAPGQGTTLFEAMRQPWGRVRFAGEHLADLQQGMEGACEAGERAALQLLELV
ncbi:flavin monoamine oxidase family protein [Polymorphobacter sp.]|uniref:flavin monoamine oxidase family protein n=1 Tax=Polymorphobacter sp. TaxID=1909290 RepID=UPI003F715553